MEQVAQITAEELNKRRCVQVTFKYWMCGAKV